MAELGLPELQRWMQAVVVHPGRMRDALAAPEAAEVLAPGDVAEVILPSATLDPAERVGIYHGMYLLRMEEALQSDYPGLRHLLGPRGFRRLVRDYVQAFPSRSYTLNRLGDHLPEFLATAGARVPGRAFAAELARVELAMTEAFDAAETPPLSAEAIAAVPADAWEHAVLRPVASLRLLALRYPVAAWLDSLDDPDHQHPPRRRRNTWVAVYRREYRVWRQELGREAFELLAALAGGLPLGQAVARRAGRRGADAEQLFRFFRQWVGAGLFTAVEVVGLEGFEPSASRL